MGAEQIGALAAPQVSMELAAVLITASGAWLAARSSARSVDVQMRDSDRAMTPAVWELVG